MHNIRLATPTDLPRLVGIYKQAIASHIATADTIPFTIEARRGWLAAHSPDAYPIYSCEDENVLVVGYLSINPTATGRRWLGRQKFRTTWIMVNTTRASVRH
jgi:L-amino acid N-acyltransferase YncA